MAEAKSRDQLEKDWWDAWWAVDFSWAGLANHKISGDGGLHGENMFSHLYGWASDYGASMWRPFAALAVVIGLFTAAFWAFAAAFVPAALGVGTLRAEIWSALEFSWANVFRPLSALTSEGGARAGTMMAVLLDPARAGEGYVFGLRMLATLQSLLAIVLAFLFALAVRRRFQIS